MFKVMSKLKSNKRGFTLVEVLVTMTILFIALTLTTQLVMMMIKNYRAIEYRWLAQTVAEYLTSSLSTDSGLEPLSTADEANIMYESPVVDSNGKFTFACCPELGNIVYSDTTHRLSITPNSSFADEIINGKFIYYISFKEYLYRIHYSDLIERTESPAGSGKYTVSLKSTSTEIKPISEDINLIDPKEMDAEIGIQFSIARRAGGFNETTHEEKFEESDSYLGTGITANVSVKIVNKADENLGATADMNVSLNLDNIAAQGYRVNYVGTTTNFANQYVCGWTKNSAGSTLANGFPEESSVSGAATTNDNISHYANIVKYHSINTPKDYSDSTVSGSTGVGITSPICLFVSLTIGSDNQTQILEPLRDFRDNVLRGNAVGEWMIDKYYDWSPEFISLTEKSPVIKGTFKLAAEVLAAFATVAVE